MRRLHARLLAILIGCVVPLLLFETGLQVAAFVHWRSARQTAAQPPIDPAPRDGRVVLCVGDSFTFGSGAGSVEKAYPAQLQALLRQGSSEPPSDSPGAARTWTVFNCGCPGRNSGELLQRLPGYLDRYRPDYVCLLIGTNDRWNRAEWELPAPALHSGTSDEGSHDVVDWHWRLRTRRLVQIAWPSLEKNFRWAVRRWQRTDEHRDPLYAELRQLQDRVATRQQPLEVQRDIDRLRPIVHDSDNREVWKKYLEILSAMSLHQETIEESRLALQRLGPSTSFVLPQVPELASLGRLEEAWKLGEEALRLATDEEERGQVHQERGLVRMRQARFDEAVVEAVLGYCAHHDLRRLELLLRSIDTRGPGALERWAEATGALSLSATDRAQIETCVRNVQGEAQLANHESSEERRQVERSLLQMAALIREFGATPILLSYHREVPSIHSAILAAAEQCGARLVNLVPAFEERLKEAALEDYFIPDGHCNDRGYGVMAEQVQKVLEEVDGAIVEDG